MTAAIYRTHVVHLAATPLGLLSERWAIEHWCTICRHAVATGDLIEHAQAHAEPPSAD